MGFWPIKGKQLEGDYFELGQVSNNTLIKGVTFLPEADKKV